MKQELIQIPFRVEGPVFCDKDDQAGGVECAFHGEVPHFIPYGVMFYWVHGRNGLSACCLTCRPLLTEVPKESFQ